MGIKLSDLAKDERTIDVVIVDTTLHVTYRPSSITPESQDRFYERVDKNRTGTAIAELLAERLVDWDLENEDGSLVEISIDSLRKIPVDILAYISNAVTEDMTSGEEERKNSVGGSRAAGKSGKPRNGTR